MPSYRDQIPDDAFSVSLVIVPEDDDEAGSSFAFQEPDQVKVGPAATQQGKARGGEGARGGECMGCAPSAVGSASCFRRGLDRRA